MEGEVGLVAGRSQREKRRSYKDLLREEEEIDAQVRKTSKKRRDSDPFATGGELHKKKKRLHEEEHFHKGDRSHGQSIHHKKKKKKPIPEGRPSMGHSSSFAPTPHSTETAMDLLQAITSPLATGSAPSPPHHHHHQHQHKPTQRQPAYKKPSYASHPHHSTQRKQRDEWDAPLPRPRPAKKKPLLVREPLPVVGTEVELEGHYDGPLGIMGDSSSSADELEAGELIIDDSYAQLAKKAKKSKKSKKKKEKEREKKHSLKGTKKVSKGGSSHSSSMANGSAGYGAYGMASSDSLNHRPSDKKKKKEEKGRDKSDKDKKKKNLTAYQIFCKEYRASINLEQPGLDFGELSKKLADAWKQLPEGDKEVWKERAQYLQHKQQMKSGLSSSSGKSAPQSSSGAAKADKPKAVKRVESRPHLQQSNGMAAEVEPSPSPGSFPEVDPIDAAAHLQLLGESLSVIGCRLQETEGMVTVSGSLSVLLDAMLCALGPLACLTTQVPELNGCPQHILSKTLDNIAYVMPGL
ncbi:HMG box-containing protein 4 [Alosa pseudoharengus]|uniref:HMG box-containing protein 4 n=1 Tax=Alosa pseudoharengus TaxID=34774 RepID=UPI003F8C17F5